MSRPREVLPGRFYMVNRSCTQRQFLLRPDDETNNAFIYCLGDAARRHGIEVLLPAAQSNHHHTIIFDRHGRFPRFIEHFHKMFARSQNARRGRWENFWSSEEVCVVHLVDRATVIAKLVYAASNPVKDRMVERVHHWPGVNGYSNLLSGRTYTATRPLHFFNKKGSMPEAVTLELVIPPELGPSDEVIREIQAGVEAVEHAVAEERRNTGGGIMGRRAVLEQSWRDRPDTEEPRRNLRPRFAAQDPASRIAALLQYREFLALYRAARTRMLERLAAVFPSGTYWLRYFAQVTVAPL